MVKYRPEDFPEGSPHRAAIENAAPPKEREDLPARVSRLRRPEEELQKRCIVTAETWPMQLLLKAPWPREVRHTVLRDWLYHIPNGGHRSAAEAGIFKAMGVKAGVWDLFLMIPTDRHPGMYLELKADNNDLTEYQQKFQRQALLLGFRCEEIRSDREFQAAVEGYFDGASPSNYITNL